LICCNPQHSIRRYPHNPNKHNGMPRVSLLLVMLPSSHPRADHVDEYNFGSSPESVGSF